MSLFGFLKPARPPSRTFVDDCVIWSLFAQSNQTASIRDVEYKGVTYQIKNEFFPFEREVVANWQISDSEIVASLSADREERFVSGWLAQRQLDPLTARVLELGEAIYKVFFAEFKNLRTSHYKIHHWDAGWFQIKRCLADASIKLPEMEELSDARSELADRIRRQTVEHAILTEA